MELYKFTLVYKNAGEITHFKVCKYPKMTALYQKSFILLNRGDLISFSYGPFNTKL